MGINNFMIQKIQGTVLLRGPLWHAE